MASQIITLTGIDKDGQATDFTLNAEPIAEGGEGKVFTTIDGKHILKLYHPRIQRQWDSMLEILKAGPKPTDAEAKLLAWPSHLLVREDKSVGGVVVPNASANGKWMEKLAWYTHPVRWASRPPERRGDFAGFVKIALEITSALRLLNLTGYAHADLSGNNILCNPVIGRAVIIDLDGLVVPDHMEGEVIGTPGFIAPELVDGILTGNHVSPNATTDRHALAVLLFELLLWHHPLLHGTRPPLHEDPQIDDLLATSTQFAVYVHHPTDKSNIVRQPSIPVEALGDRMVALFERTFIEGIHDPSMRPHPAEWEAALTHLYEDLIDCTKKDCLWKQFPARSGHADKCPVCGTKTKHQAMGKLIIIHGENGFYSKRKSAAPVELFREHRFLRNQLFGSNVSKSMTEILQFSYQNDQWVLTLLDDRDIKAWVLEPDTGKRKLLKHGEAYYMSDLTIAMLSIDNRSCMIHVDK